jgi:hypothetical protein
VQELGERCLAFTANDSVHFFVTAEDLLGNRANLGSTEHDANRWQRRFDDTTQIEDRASVPARDRNAKHIRLKSQDSIRDPPRVDICGQVQSLETDAPFETIVCLRVRAEVAESE